MRAAVIYARYSTDTQTEQSIEGQIRVCKSYAEAHDMLVVQEYVDRAMTGTNDARPAFQQMLRDSAEHKWEVILVYKLDRFSRNKYESTVHKKALKDNGVSVVSAMENIPDTPEGVILESLLEGMNQYYSMELSQKVKRGLHESYLKGNYTGGPVAYGYRLENKKLYIVEEEASIVREVFHKYAQGYTVPDILLSLNQRGLRYKRDQKFMPKDLYRFLFLEKYRGVVVHEGVVYDNIYPQIISDDLWERVQQRHKDDTLNVGVRTSSDYLLSGKLYCTKCHKTMIGVSGYGKLRKRYYYYRCNRNRHKGWLCEMSPINRDRLHDVVFNTTCRLVADNNMIVELANLIMREHEKAVQNNYTLQALQNRYEMTTRAISNLMKAIEEGMVTDQTKTRITELSEQAKQIQLDINLEKMRTHPDMEVIDVIDFLRAQFYGETQDIEIRKAILKTFIYAVLYDGSKVTIVYNYRDEYNPVNLPPSEVQNLIDIAEKKGVVFNGTTFFFTPEHFGITVHIPHGDE